MKKISIVIPTYNEEENVKLIIEAVIHEMEENLSEYSYEILVIDNNSEDGTQTIVRDLCKNNKKIKAIFNEKNFGPDNSPYYGLLQASGDCAIPLSADFQDPVEMIHKLIYEWEKGYMVVTAIKTESQENKVIRYLRTIYYRIIKRISDTEIIEHFNGFGCYDKKFLDIMRNLKDSVPFFRGVVAEFAGSRSSITYEQQKRKFGHSHIRFFTLYDIAMRSFTSYTKIGLRLASFIGYIVAAISVLVALFYFVKKLLNWDAFSFGIPAILIGMFFLGAVQLIFMGFIGEYILVINQRCMQRPLVIERERINFDGEES